MKILILGVRGMLGSMLAKTFADLDPTCWDRSELDIVDADAVEAKIMAEKPEVIINAAAYTDVDGAETNRELAFTINEAGVRNVANTAKKLNAKLVHYSTDYIFPGTNEAGYKEDDTPGPAVNVYGESKLAGERALAESGCEYYLLRTAWLYGPSGKNFVDTIIKLTETKPSLQVVNDQHGSPTFTKDVAAATKQILEGEYTPGIYHTVNAGSTTWFELAQEIVRLVDKQIPVEPVSSSQFPRPAKRPQYSRLLNTHGPALRPWQEALAEYLKTVYS